MLYISVIRIFRITEMRGTRTGIYFTLYVYMCKPSLSSSIQVEYNAASLYLYYDAYM